MPYPTTESARLSTTFTTAIRISETEATDTVRGLAVWPIADLFDFDDQVDAALAIAERDAESDTDVDPRLLDDLITSRLIAPPRCRRRRDRAVSSRAIFYQAGA